ncbi:UNVERIFIED_CONTAM: hypothetical protein K2H54_018242 [Gekko kuhli]
MDSAPELKRTEELALFETLITDALERLSDRVEIMISPINEKLQIMNNKLEVIAEEVKKVKIQSETNAEEITDLQKTISKQQEEIVQHQDKLIQIESYLRHSKIKLCGVPEDMCTSENLPQTLMSWFGDMLHLEEDTPAEALQRRKLLKETVMTLRNMGQKYKWAPSGRLVVTYKGLTHTAYDERSGQKLIQAIKMEEERETVGNKKKRQRWHTPSPVRERTT